VKRRAKRRAKRAAQLDGALALCGGTSAVAAADPAGFMRRAGELIARAMASPRRRKTARKRAGRQPAP